MMNNTTYPGFAYPAGELTEFLCGYDFVVVATVHKLVVRHNTSDVAAFRAWLVSQGVADITDDAGWMVVDIYTNYLK